MATVSKQKSLLMHFQRRFLCPPSPYAGSEVGAAGSTTGDELGAGSVARDEVGVGSTPLALDPPSLITRGLHAAAPCAPRRRRRHRLHAPRSRRSASLGRAPAATTATATATAAAARPHVGSGAL